MKKRARTIAVYALSAFCLLFFLVIAFVMPRFRHQPRDLSALTAPGLPCILQEQPNLTAKLTEVLASENLVYLCYRHIGVIDVYEASGDFRCTIILPEQQNGAPELYVDGHTLYCYYAGLYVFEDAAFTGFEPIGQYDETFRRTLRRGSYRSCADAEGSVYRIRGIDVQRESPDGTVSIFVDRPPRMLIASGYVSAIPLLVWFGGLCLLKSLLDHG